MQYKKEKQSDWENSESARVFVVTMHALKKKYQKSIKIRENLERKVADLRHQKDGALSKTQAEMLLESDLEQARVNEQQLKAECEELFAEDLNVGTSKAEEKLLESKITDSTTKNNILVEECLDFFAQSENKQDTLEALKLLSSLILNNIKPGLFREPGSKTKLDQATISLANNITQLPDSLSKPYTDSYAAADLFKRILKQLNLFNSQETLTISVAANNKDARALKSQIEIMNETNKEVLQTAIETYQGILSGDKLWELKNLLVVVNTLGLDSNSFAYLIEHYDDIFK